MFRDIPADGFQLISGKRNPPDDGTLYQIQLRNGWCDLTNRYTASQLVWLHDGSSGDVVAVRKI
jgi:hypothetical protein